MLILVLIGWLIYRNGLRAGKKGKNPFLWGILTFVAIFIALSIGAAIILSSFYPQYIAANNMAMSQQLAEEMARDPLHMMFIWFCGLGGYLLTRYILERSPDIVNHTSDQ